MFHSFFPNPRWFFSTWLLWSALTIFLWYLPFGWLGQGAIDFFNLAAYMPTQEAVSTFMASSLDITNRDQLLLEIAKHTKETLGVSMEEAMAQAQALTLTNAELFQLIVQNKYQGMLNSVQFGQYLGGLAGFPIPNFLESVPAPIGLGHFVTSEFQWFYIYCFICWFLPAMVWRVVSDHKWFWWSVGGSAIIIFKTYFSVQVAVAINNWRRPFFDCVQKALGSDSPGLQCTGTGADGAIVAGDIYGLIGTFAEIAFVFVFVFVISRFFISHYIFRWRTAMTDFYTSKWKYVRGIEGASQRIQEDTMRFAAIVEGLGVAIVDSIMTLFAFLPVLLGLSQYVSELPVVGEVAHALFWAALFWSLFGTVLLAVAGIKLPGLEFHNQRVEAAYRKELVYGEDNPDRAEAMTLGELFGAVRRNYFRLYFHYMYFNVFRSMYLQADNIFAYVILIPTIVAATITFGLLQQILTAFSQVSNSFQYLVNSWTTIVELLSIRKRLVGFEHQIAENEAAAK